MIDREFDVRAYDQGFRDGMASSAAEIEQLRAEVQVWINHTKTAVWSDSEECKLLTEENTKLREASELLLTDVRRTDVYMREMLADNKRLRAALEWYADKSQYQNGVTEDFMPRLPEVIIDSGKVARAALGGDK